MRSLEDFEVEKNAKNQAYAFILASGQLHQFAEFCRETRGIDPHKLCLQILTRST